MAAAAITGDAISAEEKRQALARVLESRTFGRSDQLRGFLRYVCEAEFEGRANQLNEYALGVSVLGRPEGYSPAEDSSVRSRAYELRNKLKSYYSDEAPGDPIQIEIEKGAYVPRFRRRADAAAAVAPAAEAARPNLLRRRRFVAVVVSALAMVLLLIGLWQGRGKPPA